VARFADETLADARLRQALADSEVARLRLLPEALANDRDVTDVAQPANGRPAARPRPTVSPGSTPGSNGWPAKRGPPSSI
jgi:two-component system C4-dicarboxylate transport sensor histidine kinase DctB